MPISSTALNAYKAAMSQARSIENKVDRSLATTPAPRESFSQTLQNSLTNVNDLQSNKANMIEAFASGEKQNVHELMISLQKASLAMEMTTAVRNKALEGYKELVKMQF
ncbi:flagellar hook-basal body complex protein FliE [Desulfovibrio inopinatus]|uniref:flagellar hook-basal body complex protein FliE n=1 Tax=Desulfovibrio inopinatus TaxID=102109 RepID=UPI00040F7D9B|nr:flagellar hook-basal body complex protein FliE [Desulfovibrio inopinatus]